MSGSYLLSEDGDPHNRTGGLSISFCSPDGHVIGGAIGGRLIASSLAQVIVCSFVYGGSKTKNITEDDTKGEKNSEGLSTEKPSIPATTAPTQNLAPNSGMAVWPLSSRLDGRDPNTEIDLTRG